MDRADKLRITIFWVYYKHNIPFDLKNDKSFEVEYWDLVGLPLSTTIGEIIRKFMEYGSDWTSAGTWYFEWNGIKMEDVNTKLSDLFGMSSQRNFFAIQEDTANDDRDVLRENADA